MPKLAAPATLCWIVEQCLVLRIARLQCYQGDLSCFSSPSFLPPLHVIHYADDCENDEGSNADDDNGDDIVVIRLVFHFVWKREDCHNC